MPFRYFTCISNHQNQYFQIRSEYEDRIPQPSKFDSSEIEEKLEAEVTAHLETRLKMKLDEEEVMKRKTELDHVSNTLETERANHLETKAKMCMLCSL
jgi:hypothetical protein